MIRHVSGQETAKVIKSGDKVFVHGGAAAPHYLLNKMVERADELRNAELIRTNPKVTAINSAIEVDINGQVCSDSIGTYHYSGSGGQMDFMRGAALSEGEKPINALHSTTSKGLSKITTFLKQGAGVVTTRAHAHYIVTEYGIAYLYGKNMHLRTKALIVISF